MSEHAIANAKVQRADKSPSDLGGKFTVYATYGGRMQWRSIHRSLRHARLAAARIGGDAYIEHADTGERWSPSGYPISR